MSDSFTIESDPSGKFGIGSDGVSLQKIADLVYGKTYPIKIRRTASDTGDALISNFVVSATGVAPTWTPPAPFHNYDPSYVANYRTARNGTGSLNIAAIGDSTTSGTGANYRNSWPGQLATKLPSESPAIAADASFAFATYSNQNPNLSQGGWGIGAGMFAGGGAGKAPLALTSDNPFDRADIVYLGWTNTTACFTVAADGGATVLSQNTSADGKLHLVTAAWTDGTHNVVQITDTGNGTAYVASIRLWNSTTKRETILNFGVPGSTAGGLLTNDPFSVAGFAAANAPVLTFLEGGMINDYKNSVPLSTFQTNFQTLITRAKSTGDCIVVISNADSQTAANSNGNILSDFWTAAENLAVSNNCVIYRTYERLGSSWTAASNAGYMSDADHPNATGYGLIAQDVADFLAGL